MCYLLKFIELNKIAKLSSNLFIFCFRALESAIVLVIGTMEALTVV